MIFAHCAIASWNILYGNIVARQWIHDTRELGALLRAHRQSKGLTQVDAAALAGVGQRFLSELERGKATAEVGLVLKVLRRFGLMLEVGRRPRCTASRASTPDRP